MVSNTTQIEVALFPIPNVVAFPGTILPLHVFEPRYRRLIHDCVGNGRMVGVSHVVKTIHRARERQSLEQALSTNQATYKPREVFSAGPCEIVETTQDGRMLVNIAMSQRLTLVDEIQSLPYRIVTCSVFEDEDSATTHTDASVLQKSIIERLVEITGAENSVFAEELESPAWASLESREFSFKIFQVLHLEPDVMQHVLETQSASARLEIIWNLLRA